MSEIAVASRRPVWLTVAIVGVVLVILAMLVVGLILIDKPRFGSLVGPSFLPVITSGLFIGAALTLLGALMLPARKTWRGITLIAWALIALTSPLFGFLFLIPWCVLVLMLPLVIVALVQLRRTMA